MSPIPLLDTLGKQVRTPQLTHTAHTHAHAHMHPHTHAR
jgi:hypothetical protein